MGGGSNWGEEAWGSSPHREYGGTPWDGGAPSCLTPLLEPFKKGDWGPINTHYINLYKV